MNSVQKKHNFQYFKLVVTLSSVLRKEWFLRSSCLWKFERTLRFYVRCLNYSMSLEDNKLENVSLITLGALQDKAFCSIFSSEWNGEIFKWWRTLIIKVFPKQFCTNNMFYSTKMYFSMLFFTPLKGQFTHQTYGLNR